MLIGRVSIRPSAWVAQSRPGLAEVGEVVVRRGHRRVLEPRPQVDQPLPFGDQPLLHVQRQHQGVERGGARGELDHRLLALLLLRHLLGADLDPGQLGELASRTSAAGRRAAPWPAAPRSSAPVKRFQSNPPCARARRISNGMPSAPRAAAPAPDFRIERRVAARRMSFWLTPASLVLVRKSLTLRSAKSILGCDKGRAGPSFGRDRSGSFG